MSCIHLLIWKWLKPYLRLFIKEPVGVNHIHNIFVSHFLRKYTDIRSSLSSPNTQPLALKYSSFHSEMIETQETANGFAGWGTRNAPLHHVSIILRENPKRRFSNSFEGNFRCCVRRLWVSCNWGCKKRKSRFWIWMQCWVCKTRSFWSGLWLSSWVHDLYIHIKHFMILMTIIDIKLIYLLFLLKIKRKLCKP